MTVPLTRILMVEDDPDIRAVAHLSLTAVGGFTVALCASGEEALAQAEAFAPDLLLLDVMMPGMDGPDTLAALRAKPALAGVPALFMTAKVQPQEVAHYRDLGAADVLPKPFDPMALPGQLRALWERLHG
ncbi:MAG TPA: response regulator [Holophaga sp.]|jgi:CheY-like chemotaxis protein|nr:response regulator [Holophaga sp.]